MPATCYLKTPDARGCMGDVLRNSASDEHVVMTLRLGGDRGAEG
jgi:hypothetical protein